MDKEDEQHLSEYREYLKALKIRVDTLEALIRGLEAKKKVEGELPIDIGKEYYKGLEHKPTTDKEAMNLD